MKKILLVGSDGFIGKHLASFLNEKGSEIQTISGSQKFISFQDNIINIKKHYFDIIILLGWSKKTDEQKSSAIDNSNITIYEKFYSKFYENPISKKIIFIGSGDEYGNANLPYHEDFICNPINNYGKNKLKIGNLGLEVCEKKNINYLWLRPSIIFGNNNRNLQLIPSFISNLRESKIITIMDGEQKRDYLHVKDFCEIIFYICNLSKWPLADKINIATGKSYKINEIIKSIGENIRSDWDNFVVFKNIVQNEGVNQMFDISRLRKLGYKENFFNVHDYEE